MVTLVKKLFPDHFDRLFYVCLIQNYRYLEGVFFPEKKTSEFKGNLRSLFSIKYSSIFFKSEIFFKL